MNTLTKVLLGAFALGGVAMLVGGGEDVVASGEYENMGDPSKKAQWKIVAAKDGSLTGSVKIPGSRGGKWQKVVETSADGLESAGVTIATYFANRGYRES